MSNFENNLEVIHQTALHSMTVEEVVAADGNLDIKFHSAKGMWWREVKPFFYQPAAFMTPIAPRSSTPAPYVALGGYYHVVPEGSDHNGSITVNEIADPARYELADLKKQVRYDIRRALTMLRIARINSPDVLLGDGYHIYLSWERKFSDLRVKRSDPEVFRRWALSLLAHPHKLILGAFDGQKLVAFIIAQATQGVGELSKSFTDPHYYHLSPASALIYAYIKACGNNPQIGKACNGLRSTNMTLEQYKARLGFEAVSYPAYISIAAPIRPFVRWLFPNQYRRLMGDYGDQACPAAA